ncbi:uncharacterized protein ISCGN_028948 [Ixodes scapularis]
MADWNRCLKRTVLDECTRRYEEERWNLTKTGRLTEEEDRCRFGGHTCLQRATEECSLTSLATVAINNFLNTVFDLEDCPRPDGSSGRQRCDAERLTLCYSNVLDRINFRPSERNDTIQSLATDCAIVESASGCTKDLIIEGCPDDSKEHLRLLESGFGSMRASLCNPELYESMLEWNQCLDRVFLGPCLAEESWRRSNFTLLIMTGHSVVPYPRCSLGFYNCLLNATRSCPSRSLAKEAIHHFHNSHRDLEDCPRTVWNGGRCTRCPNVLLTVLDQCTRRYEEERWNLTKIGRLTEEEDRCRFGGHTCLRIATEQCSLTSLATVAINNFLNTVFDLEDCPRPDGSSGRQRCDAERLTLCYSNVLDGINFRPSERNDTIESLARDCAIVESASGCTKDLIIEGCPDDSKEHLRLLESGFGSMRASLCNPELYESMLEWNQCLDRVFLGTCLAEESWRRSNITLLIMTGHSVVPYPRCSLGFYNCLLNATRSCPSRSLAKEAIHHFHNRVPDEQRLAKDCKATDFVDSCTKDKEIGGCSDELKQTLQYLKSDFASFRTHICDPALYKSVLEVKKCADQSALQSCVKLLRPDNCSLPYLDCAPSAAAKCTRDSPAMKAMHYLRNILLDLKNCSRVDWNE